MPLEFERVVVQTLAGACQGGAHLLQPLLKAAAAAFQYPHPHFALRLAEEGEAGREVLVLPGVRSRVGQELLEVLLTFGGQPVDDLRASPCEGGGEGVLGALPGSSTSQPFATRVLRQG